MLQRCWALQRGVLGTLCVHFHAAGAILVGNGDVTIDGNTSFATNTAVLYGGETRSTSKRLGRRAKYLDDRATVLPNRVYQTCLVKLVRDSERH